jgi:serine/threonine protein kinase
MRKLKKPVTFETAFGAYVVDELLGEGVAGRVYGGMGPDGTPVALKVVAEERPSADKRRRFKNEISFLVRNDHCNIATMIDHGVARGGAIEHPCYGMRWYPELMQGRISSDGGLTLFT